MSMHREVRDAGRSRDQAPGRLASHVRFRDHGCGGGCGASRGESLNARTIIALETLEVVPQQENADRGDTKL